jgi:nicotinamide mononucleotide transporter
VNRRTVRRSTAKQQTYMVGERGFEPPAPASRRQCSTRLSYSPTECDPWHLGGGIASQAPGLLAAPPRPCKRLSGHLIEMVARGAARPYSRRVDRLELLATALGLINIVLLVRRSIWNFPFGLVMVALYARIFFAAQLYSDAMLQLFFFVVQLYGWWAWWRAGGMDGPIVVRRLSGPARLVWAVAIVVLSAVWGTAMHLYTDASYPWWDSSIAVASIAAQIMLARRCLENWVLWIAVDVAAIGLFLVKGLVPTSILYVAFLVLSAVGLRQWAGHARAQAPA